MRPISILVLQVFILFVFVALGTIGGLLYLGCCTYQTMLIDGEPINRFVTRLGLAGLSPTDLAQYIVDRNYNISSGFWVRLPYDSTPYALPVNGLVLLAGFSTMTIVIALFINRTIGRHMRRHIRERMAE